MRFTKKDLIFSVFTGAGTGLVVWRILDFLKIPPIHLGERTICGIISCFIEYYFFIGWEWLVIFIPILWILGVGLGYFLGRWFSFFNQFGKFAAIGFTNAAVDFGVLNYLIYITGITGGQHYSLFKAVSFLVALINSYILNKFWAFSAGHDGVGKMEFVKFAGVAVVAALINVSVASYVVNFIDPLFNFTPAVWANIVAIIGSASALIFSFIGFKLLVFKNNHVPNSLSKI